MQYYYSTEDKSSKRGGIIAALLYVVLWVVLMLFVNFRFEENLSDRGILVDFGDTESASGAYDTALTSEISSPAAPQSSQSSEQEVMTQDHEEAPDIRQARPRPQKPTETQSQSQTQADPDPVPQEQPREVDRRALFPGRTAGSTSSSEGSGEGTGNQGNPEGDIGGSHDGTGSGDSGNSAHLAGRNLVGSLPLPSYNANEGGRVVVAITVNRDGKVVTADYRSVGSTTQNRALVDAALQAARQARFTPSANEDLQTGTIIYNFKLR